MNRYCWTVLASVTFLAGCASTTTVDDYRPTYEPITIKAGEKVAILGRNDAAHHETDRSFMDCLANRLARANFQVMPELGLPWAYPTLLLVMLAIGLALFLFFKKRGWL